MKQYGLNGSYYNEEMSSVKTLDLLPRYIYMSYSIQSLRHACTSTHARACAHTHEPAAESDYAVSQARVHARTHTHMDQLPNPTMRSPGHATPMAMGEEQTPGGRRIRRRTHLSDCKMTDARCLLWSCCRQL